MDYYQTTELDSSKIDNSGKEIIENFHKRRQREIKDGKYELGIPGKDPQLDKALETFR